MTTMCHVRGPTQGRATLEMNVYEQPEQEQGSKHLEVAIVCQKSIEGDEKRHAVNQLGRRMRAVAERLSVCGRRQEVDLAPRAAVKDAPRGC